LSKCRNAGQTKRGDGEGGGRADSADAEDQREDFLSMLVAKPTAPL